jgi:hypothetical protein
MWNFNQVPRGFWDEETNQLAFMEWLAIQLHVQNWEQWYEVTREQIITYGGLTLLNKYGGSPPLLITTLYPNFPWSIWKFRQVPRGYWADEANLRRYFEEVGVALGKTKESWETTAVHSIFRFKGSSVIAEYVSIQNALKAAYPEVNWNFVAPTSKGQQYLKELVRQIFFSGCSSDDNQTLLENYKHPDLVYPISKRSIELDIYLPALKLAFEYQGAQHERQIHTGDVKRQIERDGEKKVLCEQNGITLICIPHQWSGLLDDLAATIFYYKPGILPVSFVDSVSRGKIISNNATRMPRRTSGAETIQFMLPKTYLPALDPTGW